MWRQQHEAQFEGSCNDQPLFYFVVVFIVIVFNRLILLFHIIHVFIYIFILFKVLLKYYR